MAIYRVFWKASALRELRRLEHLSVARIVQAVEALASDPFPAGSRKLQGSEHSYRIRVGHYRVVYRLLASELRIEIVRVRHRKDVYRH